MAILPDLTPAQLTSRKRLTRGVSPSAENGGKPLSGVHCSEGSLLCWGMPNAGDVTLGAEGALQMC